MTENEKFYDAEIAPALADLANKCGDRGMAFVCAVEYNVDERASTVRIPKGSGFAMTMIQHCIKMGNNIDGYIIGLYWYMKQNHMPYDKSIVMNYIANGSITQE